MEDEDWDQDDETYLLEDELGVGKDYAPRGRAQPRGKILHFIPSEQIKLLKGGSCIPLVSLLLN